MLKKIRLRWKITLFFIILLILSNLIILFTFSLTNLLFIFHDVDRLDNGNTIASTTWAFELVGHINRKNNQIPIEPGSPWHKVIEINPQGQVVWELTGLAFSHEVVQLDNDHLLIADTSYDRVIEVNYPNKDIIWSWEPAKINWTKINPAWDSNHYYNNPISYGWSHLNDVDFKNYSTWDACLMSIRNFDLIVEVNYTAELIGPSNNPDNIVWYFGEYENYSLLFNQHNPDYLSNGNILVSDSRNNRIIEVNYSSKEIVWIYDENLNWPRDADELSNGNILITDSLHNRIFEIIKESKEIVWSYSLDTIMPYEADGLENGNVLFSNGWGGGIYEVNRDGIIVWRYGISFVKSIIYLNLIIFIWIGLTFIYIQYKMIKRRKLSRKPLIKKYILIGAAIFLICIFVLGLFIYNNLISIFIDIMRQNLFNNW